MKRQWIQLTRVSIAIQIPASSKGGTKEVWGMVSCPQGLQNLGRPSAQSAWASGEYKHDSLLGLPTKWSSNGDICKT